MKKLIHLLVIGILLSGYLLGQEEVIIQMPKDDAIIAQTISENYTAVSTSRTVSSNFEYQGYCNIYNREGETLYSLQLEQINSVVHYIEILEENNKLVLVTSNNNNREIEIIVRELTTGNIIWSDKSYGGDFKVSFDGKYIYQSARENVNVTSDVLAFRSEDGQTIKLSEEFETFYAVCNDIDKFVIVVPQYQPNPEFHEGEISVEEEELLNSVESVKKQRNELRNELKYGKITRKELDEKDVFLIRKMINAERLYRNYKNRKKYIPKSIASNPRLLVYNSAASIVELDKRIVYSEIFNPSCFDGFIGAITLLRDQSLLVQGFANHETGLLKLDKNYNPVWFFDIPERSGIVKYLNNSDVKFILQQPDNKYVQIDLETAKIVNELPFGVHQKSFNNRFRKSVFNISHSQTTSIEKSLNGTSIKRSVVEAEDEQN